MARNNKHTERLFNKKLIAEFESMDVSGKESAPEPDVAMDSDKDFEPGESEEHLLGSMVQQVPCGTGGHGFNSHG